MAHLKKFYAVTMTSMYCAEVTNGDPPFTVTKMALDSESRAQVGASFKNQALLSVGLQLIMFTPENHDQPLHERDVANVNPFLMGARTSAVVAVFLSEDDAKDCFKVADRQPNDRRWRDKSTETLAEIGDNHPYFTITKAKETRLIK